MVTKATYDPVKAHDYYERTKHLKGRKPGSGKPDHHTGSSMHGSPRVKVLKARISRIRGKIGSLNAALSECEAELSKKRQTARKTAKKNSDGKTTAKERAQSKAYRDAHKQELAAKAKKAGAKGGSSPRSSSKSASSMSTQELRARATKIRGALRVAKRLLSDANQELGQLAHSAITSQPDVNEHFARFQSDERMPSK